MDLLGNWSRPVNDYGYHTFQDNNGDGEFDLAEDVTLSGQLHDTNAANEIVSVVTEDESTPFVYDAAGNLIDNGVRTFKYDAWNRVVEVKASADLIAEYEYDALGRRIRKRVENSGAPLDTTGDGDYFYYDGHRVLEHRKTNASDTAVEPHRRYVYGLDYIDEVVAYYDTGAADPNPHLVLQDANYDVVGVTDHQGYLEQQYAYAPYGAYQHIEDGSGNAEGNGPADLTELLIPLGRNGLILDRETGLYYNRARYYDPLLSRFLQADPNGTGLMAASALLRNGSLPGVAPGLSTGGQYEDGMGLHSYLGSSPLVALDPSGLSEAGGYGFGGFAFQDPVTPFLERIFDGISGLFESDPPPTIDFEVDLDAIARMFPPPSQGCASFSGTYPVAPVGPGLVELGFEMSVCGGKCRLGNVEKTQYKAEVAGVMAWRAGGGIKSGGPLKGRLPNGKKIGRNTRVPQTGLGRGSVKNKNRDHYPENAAKGPGIGVAGETVGSCREGLTGQFNLTVEAKAGVVFGVAAEAGCQWDFPGGTGCTAGWYAGAGIFGAQVRAAGKCGGTAYWYR